MIRKTFATIVIMAGMVATTVPVHAGSLDSIDTLTGLVSGDSGNAVVSAALSQFGLTTEQVAQATPIIEQSIAKGKEIMQSYNFSPDAGSELSATDLTKMKGELNAEIANSKSLLGDFLSADILDSVMSVVKSQLPGGLL